MATVTQYYTKIDSVKVFNSAGTQKDTIQKINTLLTVYAPVISIPNGKGQCYPISFPFTGYVRIGDVKIVTTEVPDTDPIPDPIPDPEPTPEVFPRDIDITLATGSRIIIRDITGQVLHDYIA